jgi:hypothetical protein
MNIGGDLHIPRITTGRTSSCATISKELMVGHHRPVGRLCPFYPIQPSFGFKGLIFKNSVRTAKKTPHFTITKISWLTLFREIIAVYTENHTKSINTLYGQNAEFLNLKAGGSYTSH